MKPKAKSIRTYTHTVRTKDGGTRTFKALGRRLAMAAMCTECIGWEGDPHDCPCVMCPIYPWRTRTQATNKGTK